VCGHTDAEVIAEHDDLRAEIESLWEFHEARLRAGTPAHRLMDRVAFSEHAPVRLVRCRECGLVYRNPVERTHELHEIYAREAPAPDVLRSLHENQLPALRSQARALRRIMGRGGSVLEVGSYAGAFLAAAREQGLAAEGVDINADANCFTRSMGFAVHDGELDAIDGARTFDAIAIWNTFDQLADPRRAVNAASKLLQPNGVFVVRVPNGAFYAWLRPMLTHGHALRRAAARALLAQNNLLTFPYRWGFTEGGLRALFGENGFDVVQVRGDVLVPVADEWTRPWARVEEIGVKAAMRLVSRGSSRYAPWIEVYARLRPD
jgi:SAM-dependent methyltransferase